MLQPTVTWWWGETSYESAHERDVCTKRTSVLVIAWVVRLLAVLR